MICDKCGKEFTGAKAGAHKRWCRPEAKGLTVNTKIDIQKDCLLCGERFTTKASPPSFWHMKSARQGSNYCSSMCRSTHAMTDEVKAKISKGRKKYLQDNPDEHPWKKSDKFDSVPAQVLKDRLALEGFVFEEEWTPLDDRAYSIDITFPDLKLGIEINGNQHYRRDGTLKKYYQERHDLIVQNGWHLIEMHYANLYKEEDLQSLVSKLREGKAHTIEYTATPRPKTKKEIREDRKQIRKLEQEQKRQKQKEILDQIDKTKYGWVMEASRALGVSHTQIKRIVKRYYSECDYYVRK